MPPKPHGAITEVRPGVKPGGLFFGTPLQAIESFPIITSVSPDSDRVSGGAALTITGLRFRTGAIVTIDGVAATSVVIVSSTSITCVAPAVEEGIVDVIVTNPDGQYATLTSAFTYIAGHIISLSNTRGLTTGGTNVTIKGTNFVAGSVVKFDGVVATGYIFVDAQTLFCVTPVHTDGTVDVTITEPGGAIITGKKLFTFTSAVFNSDIRRTPSIAIRQTLNSGPNTAQFTIGQTGVPPVGGERVIFTDLDTLLFEGEVTNVKQFIEDSRHNWAWEVTALDDRFKFNRKRPFGTWDNVSVSDLARELIATYAPGFNADYVQTKLPKVSLVLNGDDDLNTVFTKLAGALNEGHWYIDNRSVHLFQLATGLGTSESPVSALVMPSIAAMTVAESTTSTLGYAFPPGYYYFMSMNGYGVPPTGNPGAKVYDALSGTGVNVMATRANASGVFLNYGQGGTPAVAPLSGQDDAHTRYILLSRQAANRNLLGDISNGVYCEGRLFGRGWCGVDADGNVIPDGAWPAAGPNALYFASSDVWSALEAASGTPTAPLQAYFESGLSRISNVVYLDKFLPALSNIPLGATIGGRDCTLRKIFAVRLGDASSAGGTTIQGYTTITDNVTTSVTRGPDATVNFQVPPHQNVNPPIAPQAQMTVVDSGVVVDAAAFVGKVAHTGYWAFKVTGVYRDGTESRSTLASGQVLLTGTNQAKATSIPVFPTINGVDCVFRRIYASVYFKASDPTAAGIPDFDTSDTSCVAVIPDNTTTGPLTFPFGGSIKGGEHVPNNIPPGEEDLPGPDLETIIQPEDLDANSELLLLEPAITMESDTTQLRNRVYVKGKGSILAADAAAGATSIQLADISTFSAAGGTFITGSRIIAYSGVDAVSVPARLLLSTGLSFPILQADWKFGGGTPILPIVVVDDIASQKFYGQLELDASGLPTDGVHEYTITDDSLTNVQQLYARGFAELKLFSRPIVTLTYATRDPLTKAGKVVHVDLDEPPIHGDFIIQEVTIDQIHDENDDLAPRYRVVADSAARFNMNDFFLKLSESSGDKAEGSSAGVISTAVNMSLDVASSGSNFEDTVITGIVQASDFQMSQGSILTNRNALALGIARGAGAAFKTPLFKDDLLGFWASASCKSTVGGGTFCSGSGVAQFTLLRGFDILWRIRTPTVAESNVSLFPAGGNPANIRGNILLDFGIGTSGQTSWPINQSGTRFIGFMFDQAKPSGADSWDTSVWNATWINESLNGGGNGTVVSQPLFSFEQDQIYVCRLRVISASDVNTGVVEWSMQSASGQSMSLRQNVSVASNRAFMLCGSTFVNVSADPEASLWFNRVEARIFNP